MALHTKSGMQDSAGLSLGAQGWAVAARGPGHNSGTGSQLLILAYTAGRGARV